MIGTYIGFIKGEVLGTYIISNNYKDFYLNNKELIDNGTIIGLQSDYESVVVFLNLITKENYFINLRD